MIRLLTADEIRDLGGDPIETGFGSIETAQGCLPLTALEVDAHIEGLAAQTTVRQRFRNVFDDPLEATYIFPLPPRAAVTGFRMTVNDMVIEGRLDERGRARKDYDAAIAAGHTASIAEQERADIFSLRVGNIPPKATARIELTLIAPLAVDFLEATYRFPLVVAPRYCPGVALDGEGVGDGIVADTDLVPDASRISPPVLLPGFKSPVRLGIRVRIAAGSLAAAAGRTAGSVGCTLPATEDVGDDDGLTVTVEPGQRLDRDLIVRFGIAADKVATSVLHVEPDTMRPAGLGSGKACQEAPGDGTFSLVIVPPAQEGAVKQSPRDVVFLLDRSGSMGTWKIATARRAVARMIDTLTAADRVAVLAFDDVVEHCGTTARLDTATDRHRWRLLEWLAGVEARGGTELVAALEAGLGVFGKRGTRPAAVASHSRRDRLFVLVTDCQVGDEDRVVAGLVKGLGDVSFFVVGVDTAVNEGLLCRLADSTGGMVEMVESEERLDEVMERIHQRLATPLVSSLAIHSAGLEIIPGSLVPSRLPDLVPGVPFVVRGRYRGRPSGGVRIEGRRAAGDSWQEQAAAIPASNGCQGNLWARGRLRHLEDVYAANNSVDAWASLEERIVELSTAFGVLCRFTAVVAIDPRHPDHANTSGSLRRIVQPVEMAWPASHAGQTHNVTGFPYCLSPVSMEHSGFDDSLCFDCGDGDIPSATAPLDIARAEAASILAQARPRSGTISGYTAREVEALLEAVQLLLESLAAVDAPRQTIESLAVAYAGLCAVPGDRDAFVALLDTLAAIALLPDTADYWWRESAVRPKAHDDVPF
jgi:Ca-activated chloride channel family protein